MSVPTTNHTGLIVLIATLLCVSSCKKKDTPPPPSPSGDKVITSFTFKQSDNSTHLSSDIAGMITTDTIFISFPAGTVSTNLKPTITINGKTVSPASGVAGNFSGTVNYTVTAQNGTMKTYTVYPRYKTTVFISSNEGYMLALDGSNGNQVWKSVVNMFLSSTPAVADGLVVASARDGIYALDILTGIQKWKYPLPTPFNYELLPSPMLVNGTVYCGAMDGFMYALNAWDGTLKWKTAATTGKGFQGNVTVAGSLLYAGNLDSSIYCMNIATGAINWKFPVNGPVYKNPLVVNNSVFVGGLANGFHSINATTGVQQWLYPQHFMMCSPSFYNGRIYLGGGSEAWSHDPGSGTQLWHVPTTWLNMYNDRSGGAVVNDIFYGGSIDGSVYAWNINTNARLWGFPVGGTVYSSPVVVDNTIYIGGGFGHIYAINAADGTQRWKVVTSGNAYGSAAVSDGNGVVHYPAISGHKN
jgi:outer membrane protein assembly factor BamB